MSRKIPFLEMFAALRRDAELAAAVEGWLIVSATIDKASRSARLVVDGAEGAGPNLIGQARETVERCYGLNHVKIEPFTAEARQEARPDQPAEPQEEPTPAQPREQDAFARTEAIRRAAMKQAARPVPAKGPAS